MMDDPVPDAAAAGPDAGETFATLIRTRDFGVVTVDGFGFIQGINAAMLEMLGFAVTELVDRPLRLVFPQLGDGPSGERYGDVIAATLDSSSDGALDAVREDGSVLRLALQIFDSADTPELVTLFCRDVTREAGVREALQRQRELLGAIYSQVADAILLVDQRGCLESVNPVASEMLALGHRRTDHLFLGDVLVLRDGRGNGIYPFDAALARERTVSLTEDVHLVLPDGTEMPVVVTATPLRDRLNRVNGCVIVMRAASEARRLSTRLSWQETHDPLTQLANRRQMENEVIRAIEQARAKQRSHALLYIDIYNFGMVNDTAGHAAGDELLRQFARLLSRIVGARDVVGRIGNDEFAVLLWRRDQAQAREAADRILRSIADFSLPWGERRLRVGSSIGVEMIDPDSSSEVDVLLSARAACGLAREAGRNRVHFPRKSRHSDIRAKQDLSRWAAGIADALEEDRFVVYCQPIVSLQGQRGSQHYETMVRMLDRDGNIIPPGEFMPAAEAAGLVDDIDRWVLNRILRALGQMPAQRRARMSFAVNLSGYTVCDESFLEEVTACLRAADLPPGVIQFEITETAAVKHFDRAVHFIRTLNELGCSFALDDFGSGLSSFGYLRQLPVDYLKIDGSFVRKMELEDVEYAMISTINHLGHIMGLETVAEYVENESQATMLREMGVDYGQGFYFAAPQPLDHVL